MNNFTHDSRVLKEAMSLIGEGHEVTVLAQLDDVTVPLEENDGLTIRRLPMNPLHIRLIRSVRQLAAAPKKIAAVPRKLIQGLVAKIHQTTMKLLSRQTNLDAYDSFETFASENKRTFMFMIIVGPFVVLKKIFGGMARLFYLFIERPLVWGYTWLSNKTLSYPIAWVLKYHRTLVILDFNFKLYRHSQRESFDVFHAHDLNTLIGAYLGARSQHARLVYDSHELYLERNRFQPYTVFGKWLRRKVEGFLVQRADRTITVNESIAEKLEKTYCIQRPVVLMNTPNLNGGNPILSEETAIRKTLDIGDRRQILLYSGAITFNRGLENVIKALAFLPEIHFVIMGYGSDVYKEKLMDAAIEKGVSDRFSFFGPVPSDQVIHYAAGADIGIAPIENVCLSYYYCSPNKLFEYLLAGLPVITSNFPELSRIITDYQLGDTFDPGRPEDIARAVSTVMATPDKWRHSPEVTRSITSVYSWENQSKKLIDLYRTF